MSRNPNPHDHSGAPHDKPISPIDSRGEAYMDGQPIERRRDDPAPDGARPGRRRWARRLGLVALGLVVQAVVVGAVGATYEGLAGRDDEQRYPAPGRLIDVGGYRLHLHCTGTGGRTVVLEAGLGESSAGWATVQEQLSGGGRVCSYDRAGYAWSEPGPSPRTAGREAEELHRLLERAGEPGPYILVAHSYGGHVVRLFTDRWPHLTAGLVLLDVSDENAITELKTAKPLLITQFTLESWAARLGVVRLFGDALIPDNAPPRARQDRPVVYRAGSLAAAGAEASASVDSAREVQATVRTEAWGDKPVLVIAAAGQPPGALDAQRRLAALSSRGRLLVADSADHYVHYAQPDLVVRSVRQIQETR